ncbi:hypothetical protein NCCP2716_17160 [Sporosarcina sp. NCCP-2716]|uniref:S-layer homology domain-containing protein n=1 Tax=Sporosarcina sp. NCCP-2716 TaxID=2943679 RepID=UPI0020424FAD|nr:S-layer homology domain-containing protein [Sporosarcina sp. NCCP-2716]GKV69218.1 hypothetical protein NCCP2716_17160 [Sporosarcina sp. NCCP-2716]
MGNSKLWNLSMASVMAAGTVVSVAPQTASAAEVTFKDMGKNVTSYDSVMQLAARGVISGYEDGTFRPNTDITRGQAAKFLTDILGLDTDNVTNPNFKDVSPTHRFYKYIAALSKEGVINGYVDGNYGVNDKLTRGQMAIILGNAYKFEKQPLKTNQFTDVDKKAHYAEYLQALIDNKITFGLTDTSFGPSQFVNRGQMAMFLFRSDAVVQAETVNTEISGAKDGKLVTASGEYSVPASLAKLFNASNAEALKGATASLQVKNGEVLSLDKLTLTASGTADKPLVFDGALSTLKGDLIITGENVSVKNLTVSGKTTIDDASAKTSAVKAAAVSQKVSFGNVVLQVLEVKGAKGVNVHFTGTTKVAEIMTAVNLHVQADTGIVVPSLTALANVRELVINAVVEHAKLQSTDLTIEGTGLINNATVEGAGKITFDLQSKIKTLIIQSKLAKIQLGNQMIVGNIQLPAGTTPQDVIGNYESVKDKVENVNGNNNTEVKPETPPATGGGGGGGGGVVSPTVKSVGSAAELLAALNNKSIQQIVLSDNITVTEPVVPLAGVTINGKGHTLTLNAEGKGDSTAEGLYIKNDHVTITDLKITQSGNANKDNLVEIYGNYAHLNKVEVKGSHKAGIYVNNDKKDSILSVLFTSVSTSANGWNAGIGLQAQKENSIVKATFSGRNLFEDKVAVYSDNKSTISDNHAGDGNLGQVEVIGLGNKYANPTNGKDNWGEGNSNEVAEAKLFADLAAAESGDTVKLYMDTIVTKPVVPPAGVILDGQGKTLTLNAKSPAGANSTAEGLHIKNDNVTIKNLKVTQTTNQNTDNLIEIYGDNAKLFNVEATKSKKAGIYVNNDNDNKNLNVSFENISTSDNEWKAGIGLQAKKEGSSVIANFTGTHVFEDEVAVYSDNAPTAGGLYNGDGNLGTVEVKGLGNVYANPNGKDNWGEGASDEIAGAKLFADIAAAEPDTQIDLYRNVKVGKTVYIDKHIYLVGNGYTISAASDMTFQGPNKSVITIAQVPGVILADLTVDASQINTGGWQGIYGVQVYKSISAFLDNVTLMNADAGVLANGSNVKMKNITTSGNEFGGVEVSQGLGVTASSSVDIQGKSTHEENEGVHIWTIGNNAHVEDPENQYKFAKDGRTGKEEFTNYILSNEERDVPFKLLEAPKDGSKTLELAGLIPTDVKYLAFNLMNDTGNAQKIATLEEVAQFMNTRYGATLNMNAVKVTPGKIELVEKLLSTQDWNKIKKLGDINSPYRITVLNKDKTAKIAKIAIYQDGEAVFEPITPVN